MTTLVDIDHEVGDLSEYDSTVTDGGDLSVEDAAALAGTSKGLQSVIDDTTAIYGAANFTWTTRFLNVRFYFDPNGIGDTMTDGDHFDIIRGVVSGPSWRFGLDFRFNTDHIEIQANLRGDGGSNPTSWNTISNEAQYLEMAFIRATTDSASDGSVELFVNGSSVALTTGIDLFDLSPASQVWMGAADAIDAGTSGTIYSDQLKVTDDGVEIGAHAAGVTVPVFERHYRNMR